ncbi:LLM class flavin-dependent oxidoreductase [Roseateles violae]|uniref:LLM class flavin-dependent oxidoreductase n=1 Tax=Roseateles violae TaxID=3058042 RepID=A0ABT8DU34_9BURK|nr:LLM class flavin-dependent oxidoreductase [Pelomonas sp. PFR6]MDN3921792.1 LLM class flavin-dependent oxidoreductase [Pelomonas sp. PFR6]
MSLPLSILDLAPIVEGSDAASALRQSIALAQHAEKLGYRRFWVAEHHNMDGVASSATAVLIGQLAAATSTIRVGSGGIMLPNHAPLTVAEAFGTLATLFPDRIDLGLGRAPGTDQPTMRALRRHLSTAAEDRFAEDVVELQTLLGPPREGQIVRAIPGQGTEVPIWLLGSSLYSAQLAAYLGLPFAFASHFAPDLLQQALDIYRAQYRPSEKHPRPYAMVGLNVIVADSDAQAKYLFSSLQQRFLGMQRGQRGPLPRPVDSMDGLWSAGEKAGVERMLAESLVGSPDSVRSGLAATRERTGADELIVACAVHDFAARLRSYELLAGL